MGKRFRDEGIAEDALETVGRIVGVRFAVGRIVELLFLEDVERAVVLVVEAGDEAVVHAAVANAGGASQAVEADGMAGAGLRMGACLEAGASDVVVGCDGLDIIVVAHVADAVEVVVEEFQNAASGIGDAVAEVLGTVAVERVVGGATGFEGRGVPGGAVQAVVFDFGGDEVV